MSTLKVRPGSPVHEGTGAVRIVAGFILLFLALADPGRHDLAGVLSVYFVGPVLLALALLYWGIHARWKWHVKPRIVMDRQGFWSGDGEPLLIGWDEIEAIRESANNAATPDFPSIEIIKRDGSVRMAMVGHLDRAPERIVLAAQNLRRAALGQSSLTELAARAPIPCPVCSRPSDSIKCYRMGVVLFLFVAASASWQNALGCPSCIRKKIAVFLGVNLLGAHIAWPFTILPMGIVLLVRSCFPGHSKDVAKRIELQMSKQGR